jgi:hypothetical protein
MNFYNKKETESIKYYIEEIRYRLLILIIDINNYDTKEERLKILNARLKDIMDEYEQLKILVLKKEEK